MEELNKAQIKYLRKASHQHKPLFQMGKLGLTDVFVEQIDLALEKRELIKFIILPNSQENFEEVVQEIVEATQSYLVQLIGHTAILYRPSSKVKYQELSQAVNKLR